MSPVDIRVGGPSELVGVRAAYLQALAEQAELLTVDLAPGVYLADASGGRSSLSLSDVSATKAPELSVVLRCTEGTAVLVGHSVSINAHDVTVQGLALSASGAPALSISVGGDLRLDDVVVAGALADEHSQTVVNFTTANASGATATLERFAVFDSTAGQSVLNFASLSGCWWQEISMSHCDIGANRAVSMCSIDATYNLAIEACHFDGSIHQPLFHFSWPPIDGVIADTVFAADTGGLLVVDNTPPNVPPPLQLTRNTSVASGLDGLAPGVVADASVREDPGAVSTVNAAIEAQRNGLHQLMALES